MERLTKSLRLLSYSAGKLLSPAPWSPLGAKVLSRKEYSSEAPEPLELSFDLYTGENPETRPPLVTYHGLFGSKQNWRGISRALVRKVPRKVYAIDSRNHGESPHSEVHTSRAMSEDVRLFLEQHSHPNAACMGHSMGGRSMMYFARKYPELVERLIVVDISPISVPRSTGEMTAIFDAMVSLDLSPTLPMSEGRKLARNTLLQATEDETVDFIMLNLRKDPNSGVFSWACNAPVLRNFLTRFDNYQKTLEELPPYTGPTTFICGTRSPYMRREQWPQIVEMFPNSEIHWLEAGHLVHFEQPQEFITLVTEFLNRTD
ncbi:sn-1-specific diacylglycerol lipase ABHD11 [Drosophila suzukii]|uniref:sn-1-specific diacylglycerol lipase ABHD11 n=1 Tax=Drosophila suzukii TaxID=28584 RepID=A0AB39YW31_DROSZ